MADVGPSDEPPTKSVSPSPTPAVGETLEERQERWFRERDRYERRRAAATGSKS